MPSSAAARYDRLSIAFHWATLLLLVAAFASIEMRVLFERGTSARLAAKEWHYLIGVSILLLTLARLSHRMARAGVPPVTPELPRWQSFLSRTMHVALYATLISLPFLGLLTTSALGDPVRLFFGLELPRLIAKSKDFGKWLESVHSLAGDALYVLIAVHTSSALGHHYIRRDDTLLRMSPTSLKRNA